MNLSPRWIELFSDVGIEALHWSAVGMANSSDREIMNFARANDYIVLTHDLDFSAILAVTNGDKPSVVQIRAEDVAPEKLGPFLVNALKQTAADLQKGAILTVDASRARVRLLPLHREDVDGLTDNR